MYLMDTNVVSELLKPAPERKVKEWAERCAARGEILYTSAITKAEIEYGINIMKDGAKKSALATTVKRFFTAGKKLCYAFNAQSASHYAKIRAAREKTGQSGGTWDAMIAAVAVQHKLILATRNTKDFDGIKNLQKVNPWN